jgi:hypothetical protein
MQTKTTAQLHLDREIAQLATRIDRLYPHANSKVLTHKLERLLIQEASQSPIPPQSMHGASLQSEERVAD